jgi:Glycosyltransferase family 87
MLSLPPSGVPAPTMFFPATSSTLIADVSPYVYWLLLNNKVVGLISGALACFLIWKTDGRFPGQRALAAGAAFYLTIRTIVFLCNYDCWDFEIYHQTGSAILRGTNPYANILSQYTINTLPLFALFALVPFRVSAGLWYAVNLISLFLVVRSCQLIIRQSKPSDSSVHWYADAHVILAVLLAGATTWGLDAGQLVIWTTLWIYAAIHALAQKREAAAGIALAAASLKITTAFPFLFLLLGRRHWKAWVAFCFVLTLLCLCLYRPDRLAGLVAGQLENVRQTRQVGEINDYSFSGPFHDDILGMEHWLYCLGLRDKGAISRLQLGILFIIGMGLIRELLVGVRLCDELRIVVMLCVYSCMFLYHRSYDSVILALPLFYCVDRAREESQRRAIMYKAIATGLVLVLNFPRGGVLIRLSSWSQNSGLAGRIVQVLVLPYCTWILLAAMFLFWNLGREPRASYPVDEPI